MATPKAAIDSRALLRTLVSVLFVCAMAGLVLTGAFGFETPNDTLLLVSAGLLLMALGAVFVHLGLTGAMTRRQKRIWIRQLTGRRAAWAWSEYLSCEDLGRTATRFSEESASAGASRSSSPG